MVAADVIPPDQTAGPERRAWQVLERVQDPEIPVISIVDLGIVRRLEWQPEMDTACLVVTVTPTYSGCPATEVIREQIRAALRAAGFQQVEVRMQLAPAWTTDWMTDRGRARLKEYGIAPPSGRSQEQGIDIRQLLREPTRAPAVPCPNCGSAATRCLSEFGSTPCKALYRCDDCAEPFDYFKCH